ncbi:MAG TPA: site-specific integrase [Roseomonas sp.]|nr:site-specific integrase [Roseomonas sp.]
METWPFLFDKVGPKGELCGRSSGGHAKVSISCTAPCSVEWTNPYSIEWARFASGERLPLLVSRSTGLPIEAPTYWIASAERPLNKAAATLEKQLRHLMLLYLWADTRGCTPEELIRSPGFLTLEQLNDLDRFCRQSLSEAIPVVLEGREGAGSVARFQRRRPSTPAKSGFRAEVGNRLAAIHAFLSHLSFSHALRMEAGSEARRVYDESRKAILGILQERCRAINPRRSEGEPREGLEAQKRDLLLAAIKPGAPGNPWEAQVQQRNELIVRLLFDLGMRRGEVLCLRVGDVKLTPDGGLLTITRRPQDPEDPRTPKPQVKTLGRELAIGPTLRGLYLGYLAERRAFPGARRHPFLFVSSADGSPLTLWSVTKMFKALRERVSGMPETLSAHVLRHDWNDRFSEMSDRASAHRDKVDATNEERARAYAQGWSNPATAAKYTRRWNREKANRLSLEMQERREILEERTGERRLPPSQMAKGEE